MKDLDYTTGLDQDKKTTFVSPRIEGLLSTKHFSKKTIQAKKCLVN